jgi:hypothetical protein
MYLVAALSNIYTIIAIGFALCFAIWFFWGLAKHFTAVTAKYFAEKKTALIFLGSSLAALAVAVFIAQKW